MYEVVPDPERGRERKSRILVVDDERSIRDVLSIMLTRAGYEVDQAEGGEAALECIERSLYDLVITDLSMPKVGGMDVLKRTKESSPSTAVIIITAFGTADTAVEAMKLGALDYITKPFKNEEIKIVVHNALERRRLEDENRFLREEARSRYGFANLVGRSRAMTEVYDLIKKLQDNRANVLIIGESGTGKEMVAKAIHYNGIRKDAPFVTVNCGAIPEHLIESELFGHRKGAFTGAVANKPGLFQLADGGTIFLDEIGEMPLNTQVKLLRAIQERSFRNLGGVEDIHVNVRLLAATNRDLAQEVKEGRFREDLYYRLNVIQITVPPLRERMEDLRLLVEHFVEQFSEEYGKTITGVSDEAMSVLQAHEFPGNIRELANIMERAVALESGNRITTSSLSPELLKKTHARRSRLPVELPESGLNLDQTLARVERQLIQDALDRAQGVKTRAAEMLGITFRSFRYRLKKLGMESEDEETTEDT